MKLLIALCSLCVFYAAESKAAGFHAESRLERPAPAAHFTPPPLHYIAAQEFVLAAPEKGNFSVPLYGFSIAIKKYRLPTGLSPPSRS